MRALCSMGGPLPAGARLLSLRVPGNMQPLHFLVESKSRVRDVRAQVYAHFREQGHTELELFGLALFQKNEYLFLDTDSKLSKYAPKSWRASHTHGLDANGRPLLELHLAVQFYVDSPILLGENMGRHLYYLQLRNNLIQRDVLPMELVLLLAGLALQADYGNAREYDDKDYFNPKDFTPPSLSGDWVSTAIRSCHKEYHGMSKADAETRYIREICVLSDPINSHLFRMKASKTEAEPGSVWISVSARGIKITAENGNVSSFVWSSIGKLCFDRKKFEIRTDEDKVTLYSSDDEKCKFLLSLCKETHQFSMKIAPVLTEVLQKEDEERKQCFSYSKFLNLTLAKNKNDQRVSVISTTSSNTTSGIVSDRVQSEDELEIMIDTPPAPSLESLAFAHLLDGYGVKNLKNLRKESDGKNLHLNSESCQVDFPKVGCSSMLNLDNTSMNINESPSFNKIKCSGSQCSSSCSTVVMTRAGLNKNRRYSNGSSLEFSFSHTNQNSVISSASTFVDLRLNRADETDITVYGGMPATIAASSETSGVYTMTGSETAAINKIAESVSDGCTTEDGSCSCAEYNLHDFTSRSLAGRNRLSDKLPPTYEIDPLNSSIDCIDGIGDFPYTQTSSNTKEFRMRTHSSASGRSFHGDGSDPTDKKHNILSAMELSDLIVGRGAYPGNQSVSDTLDSVSDYVRLPLPMNGESYLQGHEDTAPSEENYLDCLGSFPDRPPTPPKRFDSNKGYVSTPNLLELYEGINFPSIPLKPPPPYKYNHVKIPVTTGNSTPSNQTTIAVSEMVPSVLNKDNVHRFEAAEASARVITSKPMINILKAKTGIVGCSSSRIFAGPVSVAAPPPPPRSTRHAPPPPPPKLPHIHQLYSDVDFVVYPIQDPSVSHQNYIDSKVAASLNASRKMDQFYGSSPYLQTSSALSDRSFGSTQNLSDSYIRLAGGLSNIYVSNPDFTKRFASSSYVTTMQEPFEKNGLPRTKSDDNILNNFQSAQVQQRRRIPPPPPPPPYEHKKTLSKHFDSDQRINKSLHDLRLNTDSSRPCANNKPVSHSVDIKPSSIDIRTIREKSMNLDLPLISALCNDRSLLKQTKAFITKPSQHHTNVHCKDNKNNKRTVLQGPIKEINMMEEKVKVDIHAKSNSLSKSNTSSHSKSTSLGRKYLVRNPNDKLPEIPGELNHTPRAQSNTYVSHPGAVLAKKVPMKS